MNTIEQLRTRICAAFHTEHDIDFDAVVKGDVVHVRLNEQHAYVQPLGDKILVRVSFRYSSAIMFSNTDGEALAKEVSEFLADICQYAT